MRRPQHVSERKWKNLAQVAAASAVICLVGVGMAVAALPAGGTFSDDDGNIFEGAIEAIAAEGITAGCNPPINDRFCPDDFVTRGEMAVFLVRAFDYADNGRGDLFIDDNGLFYENAADKLKTAGVTDGCNPPRNSKYCGGRSVTRGEIAAFLVRALGLVDDGGGDRYIDDDGSIFEGAIDKLGTAGITRGCNPPTNDRFCPNDHVTRGQMAAFLTRALGLTPIDPSPDVPAGAVRIEPGESIQSAVDSNPAGTVFVIKAGVHVRQTVSAKDDQRFVGEPGAILDGGDVAQFAFQGGGDGVIIEGLVIRRYANPLQTGVLRTSAGAINWIVRNNEITDNNGAGVYANTGWRVLGNYLHHNHYAGLFCGGSNITIEGNTIAYNNTDHHNPNFEAAGMKCIRTVNLTVRNNNVHHNHGPGLWTDTDNIHTLYERNTVRDNFGPGIFHETSFDAVIRNNLVERNGFGFTPWLDGAGILLNTSQNVEIVGNTVRNNNDGIGLTYTDRGTSTTYGPRQLRNVLVRDNTVVMSSGQTGVVTNLASDAVFSTAWNNRFVGNDYTNNTGSSQPFAWGRVSLTWNLWKSAGHDLAGSFK